MAGRNWLVALTLAVTVACAPAPAPESPPNMVQQAPEPATHAPEPPAPSPAVSHALGAKEEPPVGPSDEVKISDTGHAFQEPLPPRELSNDAPAIRSANFSPGDCATELKRRKLPVERDRGPAEGVAVPVRITGEMHGVRFSAPGKKSVYGKLDCRLALALDSFAEVLSSHGVVLVRVDNLYRPKARLPGRRTHSQHRYGLAIDLVSLELADGTVLSVENDWHGDRDIPACGPESRLAEPTPRAIALRNIVCDVVRNGIFHHVLTPSYDESHRDHLHLDIKRGEKRSFVE